jgi:hypothetical protein
MFNNYDSFTADIPPFDAGFEGNPPCSFAVSTDAKFSIELLYNPILCKTIS